MASDARDQLFDFLDRKAFRPVLDKSPDDYSSESDREKLRDVQEATRREQRRFRERGSVDGIIDEFKGDMNSEPAEDVQRDLHALDLPALPDIEDEFRDKVEKLGFDY